MNLLVIDWPIELLKSGLSFTVGFGSGFFIFLLNKKKEERSYERTKADNKVKELKILSSTLSQQLSTFVLLYGDILKYSAQNKYCHERINRIAQVAGTIEKLQSLRKSSPNIAIQLEADNITFGKKSETCSRYLKECQDKLRQLLPEFSSSARQLQFFMNEPPPNPLLTLVTTRPEFNFSKYTNEELANETQIEKEYQEVIYEEIKKLSTATEKFGNEIENEIKFLTSPKL